MASHRAVLLDGPNGIVRVASRATPEPQAGFLRVKVMAAGVNPMDLEVARNGHFVQFYPAVLGLDASGIIDKVGEGVQGLEANNEVFFRGNYYKPDEATFQEYCLVPSDLVAMKPAGLSHEDAAGVPTASFAAFVALFHRTGANIPPPFPTAHQDFVPGQRNQAIVDEYGPSIVIIGGSSGVGQFLIQFAKMSGFTTVITTASEDHHDGLTGLGADHVLARETPPKDIANLALADPHPWVPARGATPVVVDAISTVETQEYGFAILSLWSPFGGTLISMSTARPRQVHPAIDVRGIFSVPYVQRELSTRFYELLPQWLMDEDLSPNLYTQVVGGLEPESVSHALGIIQEGNSGGGKWIIRVAE